jgi:hypothetical protein
MNSILVIHPYKHEGVWVFDDPKVGLIQEPFIAGADVILDRMTESIPGAAGGVTVLFSAAPFPGSQFDFHWRREESGGNWYFSPRVWARGLAVPGVVQIL